MNALAGLMNPAVIGQSVQHGFQNGRAMRSENETRNALSQLVQDPMNQDAMTSLAKYNPQAAMQMQDRQRGIQGQQAKQAEAAKAAQAKQMGQVRQLLSHAEQSPEGWQQAMSAAQGLGLDMSQLPQQYDPNWARQQLFILDAFDKDEEALPGIARELQAAGLDVSSPEGQQALRKAIEGKYAGTYIDGQGNTRQRPIFNQSGGASRAAPSSGGQPQILQQAASTGVITQQDAQRVAQSLGGNGKAAFQKWQSENGIRVVVRTGTAPDGRKVIELEDGTIEYAN